MQRFSNHSPVKMSIDLTKILAKREQEQRGKRIYVVSKSRSPHQRTKSNEKLKSKSKTLIKSPISNIIGMKVNNPYVAKVSKAGNSEKVKELLTKLKNTEDTVQTLQSKILKREEKIEKPKKMTRTPDITEFKPKAKKAVERPQVSPVKKPIQVSLSTTFNSPVGKKPKSVNMPFSHTPS